MSIAVKKSPCPGRRAVIVVLLALVIQFFGVEGSAAEPPGAVGCGHMTAFVSKTCPHCAAAKTFLADLQAAGAQFTIDYREVTGDPEARRAFAALVEREGIERPGVPTFDICGRIIVGLDEHAVREALYSAAANEPPRGAEVPVFGYISPANIGLPAFTIAIGLVDGFNPCAMWVLLFLLSILVNVKRRSRILIVAGTFVLVSGIIYFAFMAAWLNVFLILGFSRILQVFLGALAIVIGAIHLSDFFAAHKGVSLSISDSVKPRFYQRVRRVVHAENLPVAPDANTANTGIQAVGQRKIDEAEFAAEGHRRFGPPVRQLLQPRAATARENQRERIAGK